MVGVFRGAIVIYLGVQAVADRVSKYSLICILSMFKRWEVLESNWETWLEGNLCHLGLLVDFTTGVMPR